MLVSSIQSSEIAQTNAKTAADTNQSALAPPTIQPFYFSPALVIDPKSGTDVLEYRNTSTGAVINQYPSEKDLKAYTQTSAPAPKPEASATIGKTTAAPTAQPTDTIEKTAVVV